MILVVGAGPSGLLVARELAREGAEVTVVEEHREIGVPTHCAGLISVEGLERIKVKPSPKFVLNEVRGARFHSPCGLSFKVEAKQTKAYVLDRRQFDKHLATQATEGGARILLGHRVKELALEEGKMVGKFSKGTDRMPADVVVLAEGVSGTLTKRLGVRVPKGILPAVQQEIAGLDVDPSFVDLYFGQDVAPGFFVWKIPLSAEVVRVGLACSQGNPLLRLGKFVKKEVGKKHRVISMSSGLILTGGPIRKTYGNGFLLVGDAAGQTKPTTGGGVITGGICALHAAKTVRQAIRKGDYSAKTLRSYDSSWRAELGEEFRLMRLARRIANRLSDGVVDKLFSVVIKEGIAEEVSVIGDIDFQSSALTFLIRHRSVLKVLPAIGKDLLKSLITRK